MPGNLPPRDGLRGKRLNTDSETHRRSVRSDTRGISDLIGFSLTFGIIITSVILVSTVGFSQLDDVRDSQRIDNAEQSFQLVGDTLESIEEQSGGATRMEAIDLADGTLKFTDGSTATITVHQTGGVTYSETIPLGSLEYTHGAMNVSSESGAMFRQQEHGGLMKREPEFVCNGDVAVVSFVSLDSTQIRAISSASTVQIRAEGHPTALVYPRNLTGRDSASRAEYVTLTFDSPREDLWLNHFENTANWTVSGGSAQCGVSDSLERVYVRRTNVTLSFEY